MVTPVKQRGSRKGPRGGKRGKAEGMVGQGGGAEEDAMDVDYVDGYDDDDDDDDDDDVVWWLLVWFAV